VDINIGLVLVSYIYSRERAGWAERSYRSLARTNVDGLVNRPPLQFTYRMPPTVPFEYFQCIPQWAAKFDGVATEEPQQVKGLDPIVIWSANKLLLEHQDVTHVMFLMDDFVYHPDWLLTLQSLIERHPEARAWTVYRSGYMRHHKTVRYNEYCDDHGVTSISGIGCLSREEWIEYAPDWRRGHGGFSVPAEAGGGCTLDLHHAYARPGERWATGRSYIQSIGANGLHCRDGQDVAVDFVGEEVNG
jgi:hypothetical protein